MSEASEGENKMEESKSNPYELYVVCKSNISMLQGKNPLEPLNKNPDFYVGDIFQGKLSNEYNDYIQLRAASKTNKMQWLHISEKSEKRSIMHIFPPSINDFFHLNIGDKATAKCKYLTKFLLKYVDETYKIYLDTLSAVIVTYLPFSYPIFTINGTLFRGRGHFTQFSVPYFHSKSHCKEYLRRIQELRIKSTKKDTATDKETKELLDYEYEKKLMLQYRERIPFESQDDTETMTKDEKEDALDELENNKVLDAEYLNQIVSVKKGSLPPWIESVYSSIMGSSSYYYCIELYFMDNDCMVPFKKNEYLEQNKYLDFVIKNKRNDCEESQETKRCWNEPQLMAFKTGNNLSDMIEVNNVSGSRWFDIEFNPTESLNEDVCTIYHDSVKVFRCRVGGKFQGDSRSRHYIDVKNKDGDIFNKNLPMIVINLVL